MAFGEPLSHVPPVLPVDTNWAFEPTHTVADPMIVPALAPGVTVMVNEAVEAPHTPDTV